MIIICEDCGKRYRIDPEKISGDQARFKCKNCSYIMVIRKPVPQARPEPEPATADPVDPTPPPNSKIEPTAAPSSSPEPDRIEAFAPRKGIRLTGKVTAVMLAVSLLPLLAFSAVMLTQTDRGMRAEKEILFSQVTSGLANQVDEWIDKNVRVLRLAARTPEIVNMDPAAQAPLLRSIHDEYPWIYLAFTLDVAGMNVARNDNEPLKDYSDRLYYKNVVNGGELAWQTLIGKTSKKPALVLAVPIRREGQLVGVMAAAMTLDAVSERVASWTAGDTGFAFLVDERGKVVAHQLDTFVQEEKSLADHPLIAAHAGGRDGALIFQTSEGVSTLGYVRGTSHGWALAIQQSEDEAFRQLRRALVFSLLVLGATVLGVLIVAAFSSRALVTPLRRLTDTANRISVGELDAEVDIRSRDEIGDLAEAISRMQESIRLSIERLRRRR